MAHELLLSDGFDWASSGSDLTKRWTFRDSAVNVSATYARGTGKGVTISPQTTQAGSLDLVYNLLASKRMGIIGFAIYYEDLNDFGTLTGAPLKITHDVTQLTLVLDTSNFFRLYRGSHNGTLLATGTTLIQTVTWYYVELRFFIDSTAGSYELKINESTEFSATSVNTQASTVEGKWSQFGFTPHYSSGQYWLDDVYALGDDTDTAGGFLGDVKVDYYLPNADGTYTDFTRSAGTTDYELVDEAVPSATDYLYSSTTGHQVTVNFADAPSGADIVGVGAWAHCSLGTGGGRDVKVLCKSGATLDQGAAQRVSTNQGRFGGYLNDPNTASSWTLTNLNAAEFGLEIA